ncbi:MAG: glycine cleavage system protein R [Terriglobales bacterium]
MKKQFVVTATGEDRPGIVARLTEVFVKNGANLEESRMALLGGEFAAIILISVPEEQIDQLKSGLASLKSLNIVASTKETQKLHPDRFKGYIAYELKIDGADHEGIVHTVSSYLHDRSANIQSMESEIVHAPETGTPLFCMKAIVLVPPSLSLNELRKSLTALGDKESVEIEVRETAMPVASF